MNFDSFCYTFSLNFYCLHWFDWNVISPSSPAVIFLLYFGMLTNEEEGWHLSIWSIWFPVIVENWDKQRHIYCSATDFPTGWVVLEEQSGGTGAAWAYQQPLGPDAALFCCPAHFSPQLCCFLKPSQRSRGQHFVHDNKMFVCFLFL